jgi:isopenicillin N synthase-like dioxygenase
MGNLRLIDKFDVKIVDMESATWISDFVKSFKETGFAVLVNTGLDQRILNEVYREWAIFFNSPNKLEYVNKDSANSGFIPFKTEKAKDSNIKDLKEFYHLFYPFKDVPSGIDLEKTKLLTDQLSGIARHLLFVLQPEVPKEFADLQQEPLHKMAKDSTSNLLRILHYPKLSGVEIEEGAVRAAAHEDINLITLLPAATDSGLEARDLAGNWHKISGDKGMVIVNAGDMLQEATNGNIISTTHRVVNPDNLSKPRFSMPFFVHPKPESVLSSKYTAGQYLEERLKEIGLK